MSTYRLFLLSAALIVSNLMTSCAVQPQVSDAAVSKKYAGTSVGEVFKKVQSEYRLGASAGLRFFAADQFRQGQNDLHIASKLRAVKASDMEVLKYLYLAEKQLNFCRKIKTLAKKQIPDVLEELDWLNSEHVERSYGGEFDMVLRNTGRLLSRMEDAVLGKPADDTAERNFDAEKQKLLQQLHELEINVAKFNALNESRAIFREAKKLGGKRLAPETFQQAEQAYEDVGKIIANNVKDDTAIAKAGQRYAFAVYHALHVTRAVRKLQSLGRSAYEGYILDLENKLRPIGQAFGYEDIRNNPLQEQMQLLASLARRELAQKSGLPQEEKKPTIDDSPEFNELKTKYQEALQKIHKLSDEVTQWKRKNPEAEVVLSKKQQQVKIKAAELERRVSQLLLENNDLKAERDSLRSKLNAATAKK